MTCFIIFSISSIRIRLTLIVLVCLIIIIIRMFLIVIILVITTYHYCYYYHLAPSPYGSRLIVAVCSRPLLDGGRRDCMHLARLGCR